MSDYCDISVLQGKTLSAIVGGEGDDCIAFITTEGEQYNMLHHQDCCESVYLEDIVGDISDLVDTPILLAEEVSSEDRGPLSEWEESYTWTYYKLATVKGYVTLRWYGSSNGYYSESVSFERVC